MYRKLQIQWITFDTGDDGACVQGHSRSSTSAQIESSYYDLLLTLTFEFQRQIQQAKSSYIWLGLLLVKTA